MAAGLFEGAETLELGDIGSSVENRLYDHLAKAMARYEEEGLTEAQIEAVAKEPGMESLFRGERIDFFMRESVAEDPWLSETLESTPRGQFGPDFYNPSTSVWYDVTTLGQWGAHVAKYSVMFGRGVGILFGM